MDGITLKNINAEINGCIKYFLECVSFNAPTRGLVLDIAPGKPEKSSIAATGFGLAAMAVAAENGVISRGDAESRVLTLLKTLAWLPHDHGFFYHFYHTGNGQAYKNSEISTIDTAILLCGAVMAGEYFGGAAKAEADALYTRADWRYFVDSHSKRFYMAKRGDNFFGYWDAYAEQLMMYVLAAACPVPEYRVPADVYYNIQKFRGRYGQFKFIFTWHGSLFVHQYSHAFIDFSGLKDAEGTDWYENSVNAVKASRRYCIVNARKHLGYSANSWGLTACAVAGGYSGRQGTPPSGNNNIEHESDGTIAPYGAVASAIFTPAYALAALNHYYTVERLTGMYGLKAAYNLDSGWFSEHYIGIDKGITLLMLENHLRGTVQRYFMGSPYVKNGLTALGFRTAPEKRDGRKKEVR